MIKTRIIPEHEESYKICDFCEGELNDYSTSTIIDLAGVERHFHCMYAGGSKGNVEKTCIDLYFEKLKSAKLGRMEKQ
jgi:Cys-tRNA synthase (O-phospho-L-seryl-tRNA:Cys-tRNA synthase)